MSPTATRNRFAIERNGKHAEMERLVRVEAARPPYEFTPGLHDFLRQCNGVIHVGAHVGQERSLYANLPVVWVEPLDVAYRVLREQIKDYPKQRAYQALIADGKEHSFHTADNAGYSSSIFDFKLHRELWPDVAFISSEGHRSVTLGEFILTNGIDLDICDALVLDVQGAELLILQHAGLCLDRFRWVMCEAADFESYAGGCTLAEIHEFMTQRGFVRDKLISAVTGAGVGSYYEAVYRNTKLAHPVSEITHETDGALRLNLGAGAVRLDGFRSIDRKEGTEVYPLDVPDGSVAEILASHVLEHFSHREVGAVLSHWVEKLKPGGKIRLAVPDFEKVAKDYLAGLPINVQGYVMGGHVDNDDHHGTIFDRETLTELMMACGLERIGAWTSDVKDCASLPISLNLQAFKPSSPVRELKNVKAVYSTPRFGPLQHPRCIERAVQRLRLESKGAASCFWHQMISVLMEDAISDPDCEYVLTMDFDTIFAPSDVMELYRLMVACPDVDAIFPLQSKRGCQESLFSLTDGNGRLKGSIADLDLQRNLLPANTGHFGLTIFRAESLRKFPRPWMLPVPNKDGLWDNGQIDADITFWIRFKEAGFNCFLAPQVVVGHLEEVVKWPGKDLKPVYQKPSDYDESGIPAEVKR